MFKKKDLEGLSSFKDVEKMNCYDFEWLCKFILESKDFEPIQVLPHKADGGVDLVAYKKKLKYYVQCKHKKCGYHGVQPIEPIRALGGCMLRDNVEKGIFISILPYDKTDYDEAAKMNIWLIGLAEIDRYLQDMLSAYKPIKYA